MGTRERDSRIRLRRGVLVLPVERGWVRVGVGPDGIDAEDPEGRVWRFLLRMQTEGVPRETVQRVLPSDLFSELEHKGFLEFDAPGEVGNEEIPEFLPRVETFLGRASGESGPSGRSYLKRLRKSTAWIIGLGGAGSHLAWGLASTGIGTIVAIDEAELDSVDLSRQLYPWSAVGLPKAEALTEWLKKERPFTTYYSIPGRITSVSDLNDVARRVPRPDVLVLTADTPPFELRLAVDEWSVRNRVPYFFIGLRETELVVGPLVVPSETACFGCWVAARKREYPNFFDYLQKSVYEESLKSYGFPSIAGLLWIGSGMILTDLVRLLAFRKKTRRSLWLFGREYRWNIWEPVPDVEEWEADRDCTLRCGAYAGKESLGD